MKYRHQECKSIDDISASEYNIIKDINMYLGIDFGSTTTKIVLMDNYKIVDKKRIERSESYLDALSTMDLSEVTKIMIVGTGASYIDGDILGIETVRVDELQAVGLGGYFLSDIDECMVVSLGTGTSFIYVNEDAHEHAGGTGIGGALLQSMASFGLGIDDVNEFMELALKGDINRTDLLIKDISRSSVDYLTGDVTVANMAKISRDSSPEDYAYGVCNMVFQNVGVMAVLADRSNLTGKIVVMGAIGRSKVAKQIFDAVGALFGYEFIIPEDAVYGVAIGAILVGDEDYISTFSVYGQPTEDADSFHE